MRIAVMTDIHANLPALKVALAAIRKEGCDAIIHTSDVEGRVRYVNPGSLGCYDKAVARYCIVEFRQGGYTLAHRSVPYDDVELLEGFERSDVPDRHFIYRAFFGGRFHV